MEAGGPSKFASDGARPPVTSWSPAVVASRRTSRRTSYRRAAVLHPAHFFSLMITALFALLFVAVGGPLAVGLVPLFAIEVAVVAVVPSLTTFRESTDRAAERAERLEAAAARALLAPLLRAEHRSELELLETAAETVRAHAGVTRLSEDWTGATELVALYGRVALAYKESAEAFGPTQGALLVERLLGLEHELREATPELRPALERRKKVLKERAACWAAGRDQVARLGIDLATIGDRVRTMREQCALATVASFDPDVDIALDLADPCEGTPVRARIADDVEQGESEEAAVARAVLQRQYI